MRKALEKKSQKNWWRLLPRQRYDLFFFVVTFGYSQSLSFLTICTIPHALVLVCFHVTNVLFELTSTDEESLHFIQQFLSFWWLMNYDSYIITLILFSFFLGRCHHVKAPEQWYARERCSHHIVIDCRYGILQRVVVHLFYT